ncbi:membrane protein [Caldalkalibacillus thermarum]|uniref:YjiH family protein n=1 Tax=Caldalkalibacillus thermarum TaxID=296745 RepID=UPI001669E256|nr:YjiH family protein [Caldalkalibacillus thermarum]GGK28384.1 membrane protein [Caldalkalibacillus thermarum]
MKVNSDAAGNLKTKLTLQHNPTTAEILKFAIPSLLGVLLFLIPVTYNGKATIVIGIMADAIKGVAGAYLAQFMVGVLCLSALFSLVCKLLRPNFSEGTSWFKALFDVSWLWVSLRVIGAVFGVLTLFSLGPEFIHSDYTGGTILYELIPVLAVWFLLAALFMPLLMEFGLMDFIGTLVRKVMQPMFRLPGRSSIDALASWMGSGTVGVLITMKQYEQGYYTQREAAVIATNFSIASIAFSFVIINFMGLGHLFVPFYLTVILTGVITAMIIPRIPPLSRKKDVYYGPVGKQIDEVVPHGQSSWSWGLEKAVEKAKNVKSTGDLVKKSILNVLDIWFGLIPLVMALGTVALVIAEYTPMFTWLSYPFIPLLTLLQIPEATAAAPAMIVGFADMFLPAVIGSGIESELTRFVIACISLTQLIYMSEIGILLLRSKIPVNFMDLVIIFIQRTLISLPIIALVAHLLL